MFIRSLSGLKYQCINRYITNNPRTLKSASPTSPKNKLRNSPLLYLSKSVCATAWMAAMVIMLISIEGVAEDLACASRLRTSSAVTIADLQSGLNRLLLQSVYTELDWAGDLIASCIDTQGNYTACKCENESGTIEVCADPFTPGFPELKWSADTIAWQIDAELNKNPDDGWWKRRQVITYNDQEKSGVPFNYSSLSDKQRTWLRNDQDLVEFIRGNRDLEGQRFRKRASYYGDFRNSVPVDYSTIVLAGANDGMLHVFDENSGHEYFSYIPSQLFWQWSEQTPIAGTRQENLALLGDTKYQDNHHFYVDGLVSIQYLEDETTTLAVGSLGRGGKGIYGLNLFGIREMVDIETEAADIVLWEYPDATKDGLKNVNGRFEEADTGVEESEDNYSESSTPLSTDPYLGQIFGSPKVVKLPYPNEDGYHWCIVFGNGYHSLNQIPVLYVLDAYDGSVIKRIFTVKKENRDQSTHGIDCNKEFGCNGLSSTVLVDSDSDGIIDYGYGGDLKGNLWKFDFTLGDIYGADGYITAFHDPADVDIDGKPAPRPLVTVKDTQGNLQPITTEPTATLPCRTDNGGLMVYFGTGWTDPSLDGGSAVQSVYGIWDWQEVWRENPGYGIDSTSAYYGELGTSDQGEVRPLANTFNLLISSDAEQLSLLEQTQKSFVGLNYFSDVDLVVAADQALAGDVKEMVANPVDFSDYEQVVRTISDLKINWFDPADLARGLNGPTHLGWYFDLPFTDEQIASAPVVLDGIVYYSTSLWTDGGCGPDGSNRIQMAHDSCSGGTTEQIIFDLNGDELMSSSDHVAVYNLNGSFEGEIEQASGIVTTNAVAGPVIASGKGKDTMYVAHHLSHAKGATGDTLVEPGSQPEVSKTSVRGRNLGLTFWRELF